MANGQSLQPVNAVGYGYIVNNTNSIMTVIYRSCSDLYQYVDLCSNQQKIILPGVRNKNYIKVKAEYIQKGRGTISVLKAQTSNAESNYGKHECTNYITHPTTSVPTITLEKIIPGKITCLTGISTKGTK